MWGGILESGYRELVGRGEGYWKSGYRELV